MPPTRRAAPRRLVTGILTALLLVGLLPTAALAGVDDDFPPAAHWALDDGAGTDVTDSGTGGHDGVATGTEWISGKIDGALRFTAGDQVTVPTDVAVTPTQRVAIAMWVRSSTPGGAADRIILNAGSSSTDCASSYRLFARGGGVGVSAWIPSSSTIRESTIPSLPGGGTMWDGEWHHVMVILGSVIVMWLDGVQMPQEPSGGPQVGRALSDPSITLGRHPSCTTTGAFDGDLDDVRMYTGSMPLPAMIAPQSVDDAVPTTVTWDLDDATVSATTSVTGSASVTPAPGGRYGAWIERWEADAWVFHGLAFLAFDGTSAVEIRGADLPVGATRMRLRYVGEGAYGPSEPTEEIVVTRLKTPTTTTLTVTPPTNYPGAATTLTASVSGCPGSGTVKFFRLQNGTSLQVGTDVVDGCNAVASVAGMPIGTHQLYAIYYGTTELASSTSAVRTHRVAKVPTVARIQSYSATIQEHESLGFTAWMTRHPHPDAPQPIAAPGGSWTFKRITNGVTSTIAYRPGGLQAGIVTSALPVGTHDIFAVYSSDAIHAASTSATVRIVVTPDVVDASDLGTTHTTFYPVVDTYRDVVGVKGTLSEPASVQITIKSGATVVRTFSVSRRIGAYSQAWDGKNASGTLLAAGTYTIRQVVKDDYGNTLTWDGSVVLSRKKLVEKTSSKTRYANQYTALGRGGTTTFVKSPIFANGIRIQNRSVGAYVAMGYEFTLPTAQVYSSMQLRVYGKGGGTAQFGLQDMTLPGWEPGDDWIIDAFDPIVNTSANARWNTLNADMARHRDGKTVRGVVLATTQVYDVYKVQLLYTYKVLE